MRLITRLEIFVQDYLERFRSISLNEIGNAVIVGVLFSIGFVFVFPDTAITTLMHDVFRLPGPGAGIALLVGPVGILCGYVAHTINPRPGSILFSVIMFGLLMPIGQILFNPEGLGQFPFYLPLASFVILAILLEIFTVLFAKWELIKSMVAPAVICNVLFLIFWWVTIFPLFLGRWPVKDKLELSGFGDYVEYISPILILIGVSLIGAVVIGALVPIVIRTLKSRTARQASFD